MGGAGDAASLVNLADYIRHAQPGHAIAVAGRAQILDAAADGLDVRCALFRAEDDL
ncbi:hypothetical protein D3C84_1023810 [compost metagenome]